MFAKTFRCVCIAVVAVVTRQSWGGDVAFARHEQHWFLNALCEVQCRSCRDFAGECVANRDYIFLFRGYVVYFSISVIRFKRKSTWPMRFCMTVCTALFKIEDDNVFFEVTLIIIHMESFKVGYRYVCRLIVSYVWIQGETEAPMQPRMGK